MTSRIRFISNRRASDGVKRLCLVLAVSRSGFYRWIAAEPARRDRAAAENQLAEQIAATLEWELDVDRRAWTSEADARRDVFRWIASCNHRRRHSAVGCHGPADYERTLESMTLQQIAA